jgi:exopolysaccharide biosynthesis protein
VSEIGEANNAPAAINGAYFDLHTLLSTTFIKIDDRVVSRENPVEPRQQAALAITDSGGADIIYRPPEKGWFAELPYRHILASSPILVRDKKPLNHRKHEYGDHRHPRTAIGLTTGNRLLLVTVDGRSKNAAGMTYTELAKTMADIGCHSAICLDGGGSTTMWIKHHGVVNKTADRSMVKRTPLERAVANAILVLPREETRR